MIEALQTPLKEPHPDPGAHQAEIERLGDRIAELAAYIQVATYQLLVLIREFDERSGWIEGFATTAHWLNWRTGLNLGAAREKVRTARALADLPLISEAMSRGEVSYSKVRAMTRVATPENEAELLEFASHGTARQVERLVSSWRRVDRTMAAERDTMRHESRRLTAYPDEDGMVVVRGRLAPEAGAVLIRAIEAASKRLYERERQADSVQGEYASTSQRHADAMGLVAEAALAADLDPGSSGDRYQVVLHVDAEVLEEPQEGAAEIPGMAMLEDGVDVSAETSRRLACDCATVTMTHDSEGNILDLGRKTRTISPALRRALAFRDPMCRFPGCGVTFCEGHHVEHWADGGETKLENLLHLCKRHHRCIHEEGFRVELLPDGEARFFRPSGREIRAVPPPRRVDRELYEQWIDRLTTDGVTIGPWTGCSSWDGGRVDYQMALDAIRGFQPMEMPARSREDW